MANTSVSPQKANRLTEWFISLNGRLTLLFLAMSIIPLIIIGAITYFLSLPRLKENVYQGFARTAQIQNDSIENWITGIQEDMNVIASAERIRSMDPVKAKEALDSYVKEWPNYEGIFVLGPDGITIANSNEGVLDLSTRDYFKKAIKGEANISPPVISRNSGIVSVIFAVPVNQGDQVVGVVAGSVPMTYIRDILKSSMVGETGDSYLINQEGLMISPSRFSEKYVKEGLVEERTELKLQVDSQASREILAGREGASEYQNFHKDEVIGSYTLIKSQGWGLIMEQNVSEGLSMVNLIRDVLVFGILILAVLVGFIGFLIARRISTPIAAMAKTASELSLGHIDQEVKHKGRDEVGVLANSFREMIDYQKSMAVTAEHMAEGDFTVQVQPKDEGDTLGNAFVNMIGNLRRTLTQVMENAGQLDHASEELTRAATQAEQATSQIATTIQQVARGTTMQKRKRQQNSRIRGTDGPGD